MADAVAKELELALAGEFVRFLNERYGTDYGIPKASEAPDATCHDSRGHHIGIEVTSADYSADEARNTWTPLRGKPELSARYVRPGEDIGERLGLAPVLVNPTAALVRNAQQTIEAHCRKRYGVPTYLVVDLVRAIANTAGDADRIVANLCLPKGSRFLAIYVALFRDSPPRAEFFLVERQCV